MRGGRVPFLLLINFILPGNLKRGDFFKQKPAYSRRERREPTDRTTTNKRVLGRKIRRGRDSPCINFLTEILPGPALAVFAFQPTASNSHNAAGFQSLRNTKQLVLLHSPGNQKPRLRGVLDFHGEGGIRTLDTGINPYNGLANRRFRPLSHLSKICANSKIPSTVIL